MRNALDDKINFLAGGLRADGAEAEECRNEAVYLNVDVLKSFETEARGRAAEEAELIDGNDASISDRPDIEVVVGPGVKENHPNHESPCREEKECDGVGLGKALYEISDKARLMETEIGDEWDKKYDDRYKELSKENKPMLAHDHEYVFTFFEMYAFRKCLHS